MAVTLTSTGLQYPNGSIQTTNTGLTPVVVSGVTGVTSYSFSGIPTTAQKIHLQVFNASPTTGPISGTLTCANVSGNQGTVVGKYHYNIGGSTIPSFYNYVNVTDLLYGLSYRTVDPGTYVRIERIYFDGVITFYNYTASNLSGRWTYFSGRITTTGQMTSLTITNGNPSFTGLVASMYYET